LPALLDRSQASLHPPIPMTHFMFSEETISLEKALETVYVSAAPNKQAPTHWTVRHFKLDAGLAFLEGRRKDCICSGYKLRDENGATIPYRSKEQKEDIKRIALARAKKEVALATRRGTFAQRPDHQTYAKRSLEQIWLEWREDDEHGRDLDQTTKRKYASYWSFFKKHYGKQYKTLADINGAQLFLRNLQKSNSALKNAKGSGWSANYLNKLEMAFKSWIGWMKNGAQLAYIPQSFREGELTPRKIQEGKVNGAAPFESKELDHFLKFVLNTQVELASKEYYRHRFALIVEILAFTGLRVKKEFLQLTWGDIDLDQGIIRVGSEIAKGGKARDIGLLPRAEQALRKLRTLTGKGFKDEDRIVDVSYSLLERSFGMFTAEFWDEEDRHSTLHDLRAFFVNHLIWKQNLPIHIVKAWSGDTLAVLETHYIKKQGVETTSEWVEKIRAASLEISSPESIPTNRSSLQAGG